MWCPSVSLSMWANAWLAGKAAPDDVLDALSLWAPRQSVAAYDAVAAGHTGLPWPDVNDTGTVSLLQTLRSAVGRPADVTSLRGTINVVLPVPGDVRGLFPGTQFATDALTAGEAVIVSNITDPRTAIGLVPDFTYGEADDDTDSMLPELSALTWMVYSLPGPPAYDCHDLGGAEYELRSAVRSAADALGTMGVASSNGVDNPREIVEQMLESLRQHQVPDHAPTRALRVLENAAHVDAIIAVSAGLSRLPDHMNAAPQLAGTQSASEGHLASAALRPLTAVVRSARMAAVDAILSSAWTE